jgi:hypothetical protein
MGPLSDWQRIHSIYGVPVAAEQATEQPSTLCHILQEDQLLPKSSFKISTLVNTNYFLWLLCAGHSENGIDEDWTIAFENQYRLHWNKIQARVRGVPGTYRFGLVIPVPPVFQAVIPNYMRTTLQIIVLEFVQRNAQITLPLQQSAYLGMAYGGSGNFYLNVNHLLTCLM